MKKHTTTSAPLSNVIAFPGASARGARSSERSGSVLAATKPVDLSPQDHADLMRWRAAAAPFGITEAAVYRLDTGDAYVGICGDAGETIALVCRQPGEQQFGTLLTETRERKAQDLGRFDTFLAALAAVRPVSLGTTG